MIALSKKGKSVGLFFAQLPVLFTGFVLTAYGIPQAEIGIELGGQITEHIIIGSIIGGVAIGGVVYESLIGKRYRQYKKMADKMVQ